MGTLSLTKAGRLFWLGRYTERVFSSLKETKALYDAVVDGVEADYGKYCEKIGIPNVYSSTANFCRMYLADRNSPSSLVSTLGYAYDNAIVLRETIGTDAFSYIQMACNAMDRAISGDFPELELQGVLDYIMAFRGSAEYSLIDETSRTILRTGANVEHLSMALRLEHPKEECRTDCTRLLNRLYKIPLTTDQERVNRLVDDLLDDDSPELDRLTMLSCVEGLFPEV